MGSPAGLYKCTIRGQGFRTSKAGNTVFFMFLDAEGIKWQEKMEWTLTEAAMPYVLEKLSRLGVSGIQSWSQLDPDTQGFFDLAGTEVELLNSPVNGDNGGTFNRFDLPPQKSEPQKPEKAAPKAIRDLDTLFGKALKSKLGGNATTKQSPPKPAPAKEPYPDPNVALSEEAAGDSTIPF